MRPAILAGAWLLDRWLGEPARFHPLSGFASLASILEQSLNQPAAPAAARRAAGAIAVLLLVGPPVLATAWLTRIPLSTLATLAEAGILYLCLGGNSLRHHAQAVAARLATGDLEGARSAVGRIVTRDPRLMDRAEVARATTESTLENGNDAVLATFFWFLVAGAPAALGHRLVNTLDALWGYRTEELTDFGWCAARLDDLLGWMPARLTALTYALVSRKPRQGWRAVRRSAGQWPGTNPGTALAAGAGALGRSLGGPAPYGHRLHWRPVLGNGPAPDEQTIGQALALVERGAWMWLAIALSAWLVEALL